MKVHHLILLAVPTSLFLIAGIMLGGPLYGVWVAEQDGRAILARAESTRQAQIVDAKAKLESAQYLGQAADEIQTKLSPEYLAYLRIQMMGEVGEHNPNAVYFDSPSLVMSAPAEGQPKD